MPPHHPTLIQAHILPQTRQITIPTRPHTHELTMTKEGGGVRVRKEKRTEGGATRADTRRGNIYIYICLVVLLSAGARIRLRVSACLCICVSYVTTTRCTLFHSLPLAPPAPLLAIFSRSHLLSVSHVANTNAPTDPRDTATHTGTDSSDICVLHAVHRMRAAQVCSSLRWCLRFLFFLLRRFLYLSYKHT